MAELKVASLACRRPRVRAEVAARKQVNKYPDSSSGKNSSSGCLSGEFAKHSRRPMCTKTHNDNDRTHKRSGSSLLFSGRLSRTTYEIYNSIVRTHARCRYLAAGQRRAKNLASISGEAAANIRVLNHTMQTSSAFHTTDRRPARETHPNQSVAIPI